MVLFHTLICRTLPIVIYTLHVLGSPTGTILLGEKKNISSTNIISALPLPIHLSSSSSSSDHSTPLTLHKRYGTTRLRTCRLGFTYFSSLCRSWISRRAYYITCIHDEVGYMEEVLGNCSADEICVEGPARHNLQPWHAYCVSLENFVSISGDGLEKVRLEATASQLARTRISGEGEEQGEGGEGVEKSIAVQMVLTGENPTDMLMAESMQIQAQSVNELFGAVSYTTLDGGLNACQQCSSIGVQLVPARTEHWTLDVLLSPGTSGRLLLVEFAY